MTQDSSAEFEQRPELERLDSEQETVLMTFLRDFPGIPNPVRQELQDKYKDPLTKEESIERARNFVESALRQESDSKGNHRDWKFSIMFAPYDMFTGQRYPMPVVMISAISEEGEKVLKRDGYIQVGKNNTGFRFFFANEEARKQFFDGGYNKPPELRPNFNPST